MEIFDICGELQTQHLSLMCRTHRDGPIKCGCTDCVCALEGLDVHAEEPLLPPGFFLVVKRVMVHSHRIGLDMGWTVPNSTQLLVESGINRKLQSLWTGPSAGSLSTGACVNHVHSFLPTECALIKAVCLPPDLFTRPCSVQTRRGGGRCVFVAQDQRQIGARFVRQHALSLASTRVPTGTD